MNTIGRVATAALVLTLAACSSDDTGSVRDFGGFAEIEFEATGRFRVDQRDGQWWLVTPDGHAFFSHGIQGVTSSGTADSEGNAPYLDNILAKYGSVESWRDGQTQLLQNIGYNTIGDFSETELFEGRFPYVTGVFFIHNAPPIENAPGGFRGSAVDFFDPAFIDGAAVEAERLRPCAEDPYCIGAFTGDEYSWSTSFLQMIPLFDSHQFLPPRAPGKLALQDFLEQAHGGDVDSFNRTWGTSFTSFEDVQDIEVTRPDPDNRPGYYEGALGGSFDIFDLALVDGNITLVDGDPFVSWKTAPADQQADRFAFRGFVARHFYEVVNAAVDRIDPDLLNLCARFLPTTVTSETTLAAADHCDVLSINAFELPELTSAGIHTFWGSWTDSFVPDPASVAPEDYAFHETRRIAELVDKPILLASFTYRAEVEGLNDFPPTLLFEILPNQSERADRYESYVRRGLAIPSVVGAHWFIHSDQPAAGRFDGENSNFGIVNIRDEPYTELIDRMAEVTQDTLAIKLRDR